MSMSTQHTPGPWVTESNEHGECHVMDDSGYAVADMAVGYSSIESLEVHQANARLIAQCPTMLDALRRLSAAAMARDNTMGDQCALMAAQAELRDANKHAMAVIAAATGQDGIV